MKLGEVLRLLKRFIYDDLKGDYGTVRPIAAQLDNNTGKWTVTCEYEYTPSLFSNAQKKTVVLTVDNASGSIESFRQPSR